MRRLDEALRESKAAAALDPISPYAMVSVGRRYYFLRQYDSAITWFRKALDLEPHFHMAIGAVLHAYVCKGDAAQARQFLESQKPVFPERALIRFWPQLYAAEGNRTEALRLLSSQDAGARDACQVAANYASLGDQSRLMSSLDRLIEDRAACFQWIPADPLYDRWHATPEFAALMRKMKLSVSP
jgi:tetratricopeptide (TPR) repeat protein